MERSMGSSGQLVFGATLIVVGVLFLLRNYFGVPIDNWWAVFFLIPAAGAFWAAWIAWRTTRIPIAAAGPFTGGLFFLTVALIFLLDLDWGRVWPIFIVLAGVGALLPGLLRGR